MTAPISETPRSSESVAPEIGLEYAEFVKMADGSYVIRYKESGEWCIATKEGFQRHVEAGKLVTPSSVNVPREQISRVMLELRKLANYTNTPKHSARLEDLRDTLADWLSSPIPDGHKKT